MTNVSCNSKNPHMWILWHKSAIKLGHSLQLNVWQSVAYATLIYCMQCDQIRNWLRPKCQKCHIRLSFMHGLSTQLVLNLVSISIWSTLCQIASQPDTSHNLSGTIEVFSLLRYSNQRRPAIRLAVLGPGIWNWDWTITVQHITKTLRVQGVRM